MCVYGRLAPACWCKIEVWLGKGGVAQTYCSSGSLTAFAKFVEKMTKCRASDEQFWNNCIISVVLRKKCWCGENRGNSKFNIYLDSLYAIDFF